MEVYLKKDIQPVANDEGLWYLKGEDGHQQTAWSPYAAHEAFKYGLPNLKKLC